MPKEFDEVESSEELIKPDLFVDVTVVEQEIASGGRASSLAGGYDFFFDKTDVITFGNNESNLSDGSRTASSKSSTGYKMSRISFGFGGGKKRRGRKSKSFGSYDFLNMLFALMNM
ncbi:MAG: hypothetical protein HC903_14770 [Methylacidiphilales bacterium]|nr:hypothetical protein [Candidatus Methylacidiphilales bacterium]NJR16856.1 hypothetical protein [Calothrix sp. CSU_2_0]